MNYLKKISDFFKINNGGFSRRSITKKPEVKPSYEKIPRNIDLIDTRIPISKSVIRDITENINQRDIYAKKKDMRLVSNI